MSPPRFSIVICNHDYGRFVGQAIDSCLAQDYPGDIYEVIVVDDGSTDESRSVIARYADHPLVSAIHHENQGQAGAFASGVAAARGTYVCLLDSDDFFLPRKLRRLAEFIDTLGAVPEHFFLCHDLAEHDHAVGSDLPQTHFEERGLSPNVDQLHYTRISNHYPFAVPCGQVYSRALAQRVLASIPLDDWKQGADNPIAHAALLVAETVHYLHEVLAVRRIHDSNYFVEVSRGRKAFRFDPRQTRWPRLLSFLENFVDTLELDAHGHAERVGYVQRMASIVRTSSVTHRFTAPTASFVVICDGHRARAEASLAAIAASTYSNTECVVVADRGDCCSTLPDTTRLSNARGCCVQPGSSWLDRLRTGYGSARGTYVTFVRAGDLPDPTFMERHLTVHRFVNLAGVSSADIRVIDDAGVLLNVGLFSGSGSWSHPLQFLPPLSAPFGTAAFPPLSASVIRRSDQIDALFEELGPTGPPALQDFVGWILLQFAAAVAGTMRINECLLTYRVDSAVTANLARLLQCADEQGTARQPDIELAAQFLFEFYSRRFERFERQFPPHWLRQFASWLATGRDPRARRRFVSIAARAGLTQLADWIRQ